MSLITDNIGKITIDFAISTLVVGHAFVGEVLSITLAGIILDISNVDIAKEHLGFIIWMMVGVASTIAVIARAIEAVSSAKIKSHEEKIKSYECDQKRLETIKNMDENFAIAEVIGIMSQEEYDVILKQLYEKYDDIDARKELLALMKRRFMTDKEPSIFDKIWIKVKIFMYKCIS